jgi:hypothetical protein
MKGPGVEGHRLPGCEKSRELLEGRDEGYVAREVAPTVGGEPLVEVGAVEREQPPEQRLDLGEGVEGHAQRRRPRESLVQAAERLAGAAERRPHLGGDALVKHGGGPVPCLRAGGRAGPAYAAVRRSKSEDVGQVTMRSTSARKYGAARAIFL